MTYQANGCTTPLINVLRDIHPPGLNKFTEQELVDGYLEIRERHRNGDGAVSLTVKDFIKFKSRK